MSRLKCSFVIVELSGTARTLQFNTFKSEKKIAQETKTALARKQVMYFLSYCDGSSVERAFVLHLHNYNIFDHAEVL